MGFEICESALKLTLETYNNHVGSVQSNNSSIYQLFLEFWEMYGRKNKLK